MGIGIEEDHVEHARVARRLLSSRGGTKLARAALEGDTSLPAYWSEIVELGWLGLHVPEELGGSGFGLLETAIAAEELGKVCAPGPYLSVVAAAAAIADAGTVEQRRTFVPRLVDGSVVAGVATGSCAVAGGRLHVARVPVLGGDQAALVLVVAGDDVVLVDRDASGVSVTIPGGLDPGLGFARLSCESVEVDEGRIVVGGAAPLRHALAVVVAATAVGGATACREMAAEYAKSRVAFGRPIGQFQAVKHHCANMLINEELAVAAVWNVARLDRSEHAVPFGQAALGEALSAFFANAKLNLQVLGGIGYTWEHDAHLFLRRASALVANCGSLDRLRRSAAELGLVASASRLPLALPQEAEEIRASVREFVAAYHDLPDADRHAKVLDHGYLFPHWPRPWGRDAGAVEQLVVAEELNGLDLLRPVGPSGWTLPIVVPTILSHGSEDQIERWIRPTMEGRLAWCYLMSEPGAGSDLASLTTRAARADGGWLVTGQKVWSSGAQDADVGFALVRTDPKVKHAGITCMVVDLRAAGVTIRPLRQITGVSHFNEVFLDDVFVSDDDVLGAVNDGWKVTRTSLGNERVSLGDGLLWAPPDLLTLIEQLATAAAEVEPAIEVELGALAARAWTISALNARGVAKAMAESGERTDGNLAKLVVAEFSQAACELGLRAGGADAVFADSTAGGLVTGFLASRAATIGGGTSEIMRNVIGERMLGLPRDDDRVT